TLLLIICTINTDHHPLSLHDALPILVEKTQGVKVMAKVFTLPDVQVGSIIEYRYKLRYDDHSLKSPDWYIQTDLWTRKSHYMWRSEEHTSELQSLAYLVCRLLLEKKK